MEEPVLQHAEAGGDESKWGKTAKKETGRGQNVRKAFNKFGAKLQWEGGTPRGGKKRQEEIGGRNQYPETSLNLPLPKKTEQDR